MDPISFVPSTPKRTQLTRDDRRSVHLLRSLGWSYVRISKHLHCTERQVQWTCQHPATPKKRVGRPTKLNAQQVEKLIEFVTASRTGRRMSYSKLATTLNFGCSEHAIRSALKREGFTRRLAMRKPPISEKNRVLRLAWAHEHINWSREQWDEVLWTDETWITGGRHTRTWVTRRPGEEWIDTCIVEREQRKKGWMF
jgi:transposase